MKYLKIELIITLLFFLFFISCDNCNDNDCYSNAIFEYTLIDSNNNNLFLTDDYDINIVQITAFKENVEISNGGITGNSIIYLEVIKNIDSIIVDYGNNSKDTFTFGQLSEESTECCGTYIDDFEININEKIFCNECNNKLWEIIR